MTNGIAKRRYGGISIVIAALLLFNGLAGLAMRAMLTLMPHGDGSALSFWSLDWTTGQQPSILGLMYYFNIMTFIVILGGVVGAVLLPIGIMYYRGRPASRCLTVSLYVTIAWLVVVSVSFVHAWFIAVGTMAGMPEIMAVMFKVMGVITTIIVWGGSAVLLVLLIRAVRRLSASASATAPPA